MLVFLQVSFGFSKRVCIVGDMCVRQTSTWDQRLL